MPQPLFVIRDLEKINFFVVPEIPFYIGPIGIVPYIMPGTRELADAVTSAMKRARSTFDAKSRLGNRRETY